MSGSSNATSGSTDLAAREDAAGAGVYEWRPAEDRLLWSPRLLRLYGLSEPPSGEAGFSALVHPDDRVRVEAETADYLGSDARDYCHLFRIVRPDGSVRLVVDSGEIERDARGRVRVIRGMNVDITRVSVLPDEARAALKRSGKDEDLEVLYTESPLGMAILDPGLHFLRVNEALAEINGYSPEQHVGRHAFDVAPGLRQAAEPALLRVLDTGVPLRNVVVKGETPAFPGVTREWRQQIYPLRGTDGEIRALGVISEDVTERLAAQRVIAAANARNAFLLRLDQAMRSQAGRAATEGTACRLLAEHLEADRVHFMTVDEESGFARVAQDHVRSGARSLAGDHKVQDLAWSLATLRRGACVVVNDIRASDPVPLADRSACAALDIVAYMGAPLIRDGRLVGALCVGSRSPRVWVEGELDLVRDVAERVWSAVVAAEAEAALARSEARFRLALAGSPITVFEHDADLRYSWLFNSKLGYSDTYSLGKTDLEIMDEAAAVPLMELKRSVLLGGETARREVTAAAPGQPLEHYDLHVHPRRDERGRIIGLTCVSTDITEKKRTESALRSAEDTFRQLVVHSPFGIYAVDADFRIAHVSDGAQKVFENVRPLIGRDLADVLRIIWPEPFASEAIGRFRHTLATGEAYHAPGTVERRLDVDVVQSYDWKVERIVMPDGRHGVVCHFYDLSERRAYQAKIESLMREVNHRAKNMLSLVQAVARQTAASGTDEFLDRFGTRLRALAASHDLLIRADWDGAELSRLVRSQLLHFEDLVGTRIRLAGPPVNLSPAATQTIGMALHEIATNAAKYGALSNDTGRVEVSWEIKATPDGPCLSMAWIETGGPGVAAPTHEGFGQRVAKSMVEAAFGCKVVLDFPQTGFRWLLECRLAALGA